MKSNGKPDGNDQARSQKSSGRQARAMTRAIDMVSEDFIESFSQTGKDDGPEVPTKPAPVREALIARDRREEEEAQRQSQAPAFKGFGALLAGAKAEPQEPVQTHALDSHEAESPAAYSEPHSPGSQTNEDGSVIKVRETSGKKRGLYTSCMQRPTPEQLQDAAVKFSRPSARNLSGPQPATTAPADPVHEPSYEPASDPIDEMETPPSEADRRFAAPSGYQMPTRASAVSCGSEEGSSCPIACAFSKLFAWFGGLFRK